MDTFAKFIDIGPHRAHNPADKKASNPSWPMTSSRTTRARHIALRFEPMRNAECTLVTGMR